MVKAAGLPQSTAISAENYFLSLLALKLAGHRALRPCGGSLVRRRAGAVCRAHRPSQVHRPVHLFLLCR
ncbi:MAG: hypothetical protein M0C28_16915 [Candidatus Moduliflexus flocculans]|nr:hypothetical protein [Candidatus Moduliflexus flocculans]